MDDAAREEALLQEAQGQMTQYAKTVEQKKKNKEKNGSEIGERVWSLEKLELKSCIDKKQTAMSTAISGLAQAAAAHSLGSAPQARDGCSVRWPRSSSFHFTGLSRCLEDLAGKRRLWRIHRSVVAIGGVKQRATDIRRSVVGIGGHRRRRRL